jgi:hypothetical protein
MLMPGGNSQNDLQIDEGFIFSARLRSSIKENQPRLGSA